MLGAIFTALIAKLGYLTGVAAIPARFPHRWRASPESLVREALEQGAKVLVSTYNEPLITSEWAIAVFKGSQKPPDFSPPSFPTATAPRRCSNISALGSTCYKVDLKSFDDRHYHELGGRIGPILDSIRRIHQMGLWLEIVTLLIPGFNDSPDELSRLYRIPGLASRPIFPGTSPRSTATTR